jgi:hypothetical protein
MFCAGQSHDWATKGGLTLAQAPMPLRPISSLVCRLAAANRGGLQRDKPYWGEFGSFAALPAPGWPSRHSSSPPQPSGGLAMPAALNSVKSPILPKAL